jgi:hypothetical protein
MKTTHIYFGEVTLSRQITLRYYDIIVDRGFNKIEIIENEKYCLLKPFFDKWDFSYHAFSKFDNTELNNAKLLQCYPNWQSLYPESADDDGYKELTYNTNNYCKEFGTGLVQKAPFRIKQEPKWGNKKSFLLHWIFDEIFVHNETYEKIFKPIGIAKWPVLLFKKDIIVESTVQLIIPEIDVNLNLKNYPKEISQTCNVEKYDLINHGFFPNFSHTVPDKFQIFKSKEYFSGGSEARKMIFVTQNLRKIFINEKIDMTYHPLAI